MSDLAALEILASINKLASEVNNMNQSKGFSWVGPIIGVITGFSINLIYNYIYKKLQTNRYRKCIDNEVKRMKNHAVVRIEAILKSLDDMLVDSNRMPNDMPMNFKVICYEKFYHEIVDTLKEEENNNLCFAYSYLADGEAKTEILDDLARTGKLHNIYSLLEGMLTSYCGLYITAKLYIASEVAKEFDKVEIANELGIKSTYIENLS